MHGEKMKNDPSYLRYVSEVVSIQLFRIKLWFEFIIYSVHAIRTTKFATSSLKAEEGPKG
jgi:hypothetical protein